MIYEPQQPMRPDEVELRAPALRELLARGFLYQCTDLAGLDARMAEGPITVYYGCDLTAPSLHIGNFIGLMALRALQRHGHRPILLLGGGTTKIGDPSGRDSTRQLLDEATIAEHRDRIERVFRRFLRFGDGPADAVLVDNADWLDAQGYIDFLRRVGPHFSVNRMLAMDSVATRLEREQSLSFLEFNYMVLQAYDFVELHERLGCTLQIGGSDQWGNIVNGVELGRRMAGAELVGLTWPLLTTAAGAKMGKTAEGAVWLSADMFDPYAFWQYLRDVDDADVGRLLRLFTELDAGEVGRLAALEGSAINEAKLRLADEATTIVHGAQAAATARATAEAAFSGGGAAADLPTVELSAAELDEGVPFFDLLRRSGLAGSGGEARRLVKQRGARLNGEVVEDAMRPVTRADLGEDGRIRLQAGKKRHALARLSG